MKIGWSTGYHEGYWGQWPWVRMFGGSERIVVYTAIAQAKAGHEVTVRLPWDCQERIWEGVRWVGQDHASQKYDALFCADDFDKSDRSDRCALVACRSDAPRHTDFSALIFLSETHARFCGFAGSPVVGGGVDLADYARQRVRLPRRVICTSSPDRCPRAAVIGRAFDFRHAYKPVQGFTTTEFDRPDLIAIQLSAQVMVYPLEPSRPSDFFSMAVLEAMASGTPVVVSDADSMRELWNDAAIVLPNPLRLSSWHEAIDGLLRDRNLWAHHSEAGIRLASVYTWDQQAVRYLAALGV